MDKFMATKYVIRKKGDYGDYLYQDGDSCISIYEANKYDSYKLAKEELTTLDEPKEFVIVRVVISISEEEEMC